jgi:hypothetical protein
MRLRAAPGREADLFAGEDLKMYGGRSREAYVNRLRDSVDPLAAPRWGARGAQLRAT